MNKFIHVFLICIISVFIYTGCATTGGSGKQAYSLSAEELDKMSKSDNITPEQKVILKHAMLNLKQAEKIQIKNEKLQEEIIKDSKLAGAGKMIYTIIFLIIFGVISYIGFKILKRFYII